MEVTETYLLDNWNDLHRGFAFQPAWSEQEKGELICRIIDTYNNHRISIELLPRWRNKRPEVQKDEIIRLFVKLGSMSSPHLWKVDHDTLTKGHNKTFRPSNHQRVTGYETAISVLERLGPDLQHLQDLQVKKRRVPVESPTGSTEFLESSELIESIENVLALLRDWHRWETHSRRVLSDAITSARPIFKSFGGITSFVSVIAFSAS